jgi:hypothetical protein
VNLAATTTVHELLEWCPDLARHIHALHPSCARLDDGERGAKWRRVTTCRDLAVVADLPTNQLLRDLRAEALRLSCEPPALLTSRVEAEPDQAEELREIVAALEDGGELLALAERYRDVTAKLSPELSAGIEALVAEGRPQHEVIAALAQPRIDDVEDGHPLATLRREHEALHRVLLTLASTLDRLEHGETGGWRRTRPLVVKLLGVVEGYERHCRRCERLVFPLLVRHGREDACRLVAAAWTRTRERLAAVRAAAGRQDPVATAAAGRRLVESAAEAIGHEEHLLLPLAEATLSREEWEAVRAAEAGIGWALVEEPPPWPRDGGGGDPRARRARKTADG